MGYKRAEWCGLSSQGELRLVWYPMDLAPRSQPRQAGQLLLASLTEETAAAGHICGDGELFPALTQ